MERNDLLSLLLRPRFDRRLRTHISKVQLSPLSRLPIERLERTALPNIALIELVDGYTFDKTYKELYNSNFHDGERERADLIVKRLDDDFSGQQDGFYPYRIIGLRNAAGQALGAAQFSVLLLPGDEHAVPYLQYLYVRSENRRQDLSEVMHTLVLAVAMADAAHAGNACVPDVPFTLMETEPPVHGVDESKRANAAMRTQIHTKSGSFAMMLQRPDGTVLSAHVQPGLETDDPPLTYVWALRTNPAKDAPLAIDNALGKRVIAAYYQSLRDEGFPERNIAVAERLVDGRYCGGAEFNLLQLGEITKEMYIGID